jgi:PAS domain S-box-containing protein
MSNKVNILVVDDRPEGVLAVQAVLNSPSYNIVTASSGNEALKHLLKDDFAVILLDVQMPIMNGFETASVIKTREKSKDIPIIFMSAINQDEQYVYQGYGVGAIDYLLKPFDPYILRSKVSIFVDIYRKNLLIKEQAKLIQETEAKAHAQELDRLELENLRKYQNLADSIPQIVFRLKPDGEYDYFNKVWFEYTGLSQASSSDFKWKDVIHPSDIEKLTVLLTDPSNPDGIECECRILSMNGVFRWHLIRVQPEKYDHEPITFWLGTATDIEDRRQSEETQRFLAEAGEILVSSIDYRKTLQSISQLAVPYLADWCSFDIVNEAGELENLVINHKDPKSVEHAKMLHDKYLCHPEGKVGAMTVIKTGKTQVFNSISNEMLSEMAIDETQVHLAKELGDTAAMIIPVTLHGKVFGALTFASAEAGMKYDHHSVSTAEELARRVALAFENSNLYKISQDAIEIRNDFLSIASHELNTPITSLKLQLQMVKKGLLMGKEGNFPLDRFSKSVEASVKQVDRLINLISILLDVSRIQSGKFTFSFLKFNAKDIIAEVVDRHKELLQNAECTLDVSGESDITVVWDKTRIEQVLTNLLTNAIKYAPGKIELIMKEDKNDVVISVRDHGQGIDKEKLTSIFDRFERATSNESVSGLGLGLFIVKQIAEGHHGSVKVESVTDEGSTFSLRLPKDATQFVLPSSPTEARIH